MPYQYSVESRFIKYAQIDTTADPNSETFPSSLKQKDLAKVLYQELIDLGQSKILISKYYNLSSINFIPDILEEIGIVGDWVIEKPGIDKEKYLDFMNKTYGPLRPRTNDGLNKLKKPIKSLTKSQLQAINHKR